MDGIRAVVSEVDTAQRKEERLMGRPAWSARGRTRGRGWAGGEDGPVLLGRAQRAWKRVRWPVLEGAEGDGLV